MLAGACFRWHVPHEDPQYLVRYDRRFSQHDPGNPTVH